MPCRFEERLKTYGDGIPEEARRVIDEELAKLGSLEPVQRPLNPLAHFGCSGSLHAGALRVTMQEMGLLSFPVQRDWKQQTRTAC